MLPLLPWLLAAALSPSSLLDRVVLADVGGVICVDSPTRGWTANHVADKMKTAGRFGWTSGALLKGTIRVTGEDPKRDAARVLRDSGDAFPSEPAPSVPGELRSGDPIIVIGDGDFVLDRREPAVVRGWYVGKDGRGDLVLDIALYPGFSGGCLFDLEGNLRGIAKQVSADQRLIHLRSWGIAFEVRP